MPLPLDYTERVYAGVLGKIIGVYLGRPFEGWTYERIMAELGEINYYVHDQLGAPLIVTDDDISGTFSFLRALEDYGPSADITPAQISQTWLNYIIEGRTILWWGGMGASTEHTAYLRLKSGVQAPTSGSMVLNGKVVAEQIGAQIFVDGWGMVAPGNPALAADLARRAASVSHDGEAVYGAQVIAAMEAQAFVEPDLNKLLDCGVSLIPRNSLIYKLISDIREWHAENPDWRRTRERIAERYGYDKYGGGCHVVPNHALVIAALLHGEDDFQRSLMIVNTCGWDTDCNSGNVGCLLGIKNGLAGLESGPDFRGPVVDRLYLSTADGGRAVTEAVTEAYRISSLGRALAGEEESKPKAGARYHFEVPGAVQGWMPEVTTRPTAHASLENVEGHSRTGTRSLAVHYRGTARGVSARVATATFTPSEARDMPGYALLASPALYPGQTVRARVEAAAGNHGAAECRLYLRAYSSADEPIRIYGPHAVLAPGEEHEYEWQVPPLGGRPIESVGLEISSEVPAPGTVYVDYLSWSGEPDVMLARPAQPGDMWRRAWVNGVDHFHSSGSAYRLMQDSGTGLLIQGTREWRDYRATAIIAPHLLGRAGLAVRVQGMRRYYALLLAAGSKVQLLKALDGEVVLAEAAFSCELDVPYRLEVEARGTRLRASIDDKLLFEVEDTDRPLTGGAVALLCTEGRLDCDEVRVQPVR